MPKLRVGLFTDSDEVVGVYERSITDAEKQHMGDAFRWRYNNNEIVDEDAYRLWGKESIDQALATVSRYDSTVTPPLPVDVPTIYAMAQFTIADGEIASINISSRLAAAFRMDVGQYWVFFIDPLPDANYLALVYDSDTVRAFVRESDKTTDYFVITAVDFAGEPADPTSISVEIKRVN